MAGDIAKITKELIKIQKVCIYDSRHILCKWNTIFILLSCKIILTAVIHLADRISIKIFKPFKEIYMYYFKRGFQITTLHVDD